MSTAADEAKIRVRTARADDAPVLADLCTQLGYPSTPKDLEERLETLFGDPDHVVFIAELEGGRVAGFLHGFLGLALETGPRAEILGLVADAAVRGRGIGRRLVR